MARMDYPRGSFEVIVVDDGGQTVPEALKTSFKDRLDVSFLVQEHAGPARARNTGAAKARGRFLVFTDDDCLPASDWLQTLALWFERVPEHAIGGRTVNALPDNPYSSASQILIDYLYSYYNADPDQARFFASNNLALPAERFRAIGSFNGFWMRAAAEDRELCDRWLRQGLQMTYAEEVIVYHAHALTLRTFLRQHFSYGRGAFWFHRTRTRRGMGPLKVEPVRFYRNLLLYPFAQKQGSRRRTLLMGLLLVSQIANAVGFFWERYTTNPKGTHPQGVDL
jgi:glycosyltransferase involved in cell wall biosynthesis